jgi:hypothetical protein
LDAITLIGAAEDAAAKNSLNRTYGVLEPDKSIMGETILRELLFALKKFASFIYSTPVPLTAAFGTVPIVNGVIAQVAVPVFTFCVQSFSPTPIVTGTPYPVFVTRVCVHPLGAAGLPTKGLSKFSDKYVWPSATIDSNVKHRMMKMEMPFFVSVILYLLFICCVFLFLSEDL